MQTVDELILQNLKTTLDAAPGFTSATVFRFAQVEHSYNIVPCIDIIYGGAELIKTTNIFSDYDLTVYVDVYARDTSANTDAVMSALVGEIIKAIMADPTRGRYALNTDVKRIEPFMTAIGQPEVMRSIELNIRYRSNTKNPDKI
ncbi:MAG: hypothetical protein WC373_04965 [Smithella sp.]|jgi:hypothetical protein